ncbi:MAG TPA: purine-nucleoside phosphorylase [Malonomonas sp.]
MIPLDDISAALQKANSWLGNRSPELAVVLGSGLSGVVESLKDSISLTYAELPGFPGSGVVGHAGQLHCGTLLGRNVLVFQGRYHVYEGYSAWQVTATVRLAAALGCRKLLLTNAAGGINAAMRPGDFMLVTDHLNLVGENPMIGRSEREFTDLTQLYRQDFYPRLQQQLAAKGVRLHKGVLAWMLGPSYETPAEIRMLAALGADAVSMSTIPEAIIARRYKLETVAVSFISNLAAGKSAAALDHQDVLACGQNSAADLLKIMAAIFPFLCD